MSPPLTTPDHHPLTKGTTMTNPSTTPASNDVAEDLLAQDLLAQRLEALAGAAPIAAAPRGRPSLTMILAGVVGAAVLFAGGLLVGHTTGSSTTAQSGPGANGLPGGAGGDDGAAGTGRPGGFTSGEIASIDGSTLTITTSDGTTVKVTTSTGTTVSKSAATDVSALAVGDTVTVVGQTASDSSVTAQAITEGSTGFGAPDGTQN